MAKPDLKGKRGDISQQGVPVTAVRVKTGDIPVYVTGLGSVIPLATVTVKSRVDGQLMHVQYREGDSVTVGQVLMEIDPRPYQVQLTQAEGQLAKDQAALENARIDLNRYETLLKQNAIPEQQVATQRATVMQDEGTVKSDQGQVDAAKLNLTYCRITSPITGRVGLRLVDAGNMVHASDLNGLVVITQMDPTSVVFTVAEDQLPAVLQKMRAGSLAVDAYDRDLKVKLAQGALSTTDNEIDQTTGTIRLRATFSNSSNNLFPNQFVNARLLLQLKHGVLLLPEAAIQRNSTATFIYLVQADSTVVIRNVQIGTTEGGMAEITSGVQSGDVVVLSGADKLEQGTRVSAQIPEEDTGQKSGQKPGQNTSSGSRSKKRP
jgi:membrane fusion protein, multidrug efflux system